MGCLEKTVNVQTIVQGEAMPVKVRLVTQDPGDPFDLTLATEIVAIFKTVGSPGYVEKKLSNNEIIVDSAVGGRFHVLMTSLNTQALVPGPADFEVRVTMPDGLRIVQIADSLNVVASLFPTAP